MRRRFWIGLVLALPVIALEMHAHLTGRGHQVNQQTPNLIQMALATPVVLWAGWPFFVRAGQSLVTRNLNMFTLIAMGTQSLGFTALSLHWPLASSLRHSVVTMAQWQSTSRLQPRSPCLFCSGKCSNCVRGKARAERSALSLTSHRRRRGVLKRMARKKKFSSKPCKSAIVCVFVQGKRCRWTARCLRGVVPSTSRWLRASQCRSQRRPALQS